MFYIFVRQDIPIEQQIIQTNHATLEMSKITGIKDIPSICLIGVPNWMELDKVRKHLKLNEIKYAEMNDTDFDFRVASVVTVPLEEDRRKVLKGYPLWKPSQ